MARKPALTLAFLEAQPRAAAGVLQELAPESAAALLSEIPAALAARAVADMTSWSAARCLGFMDPAQVALILAAMHSPQATHLLRLFETQRAREVLEDLPASVASAYQRSLAFAPSSVGAWTDHSIALFKEDDSVQQALAWLAQPRTAAMSHVFVVDAQQRLAGAVALPVLLGATRQARLRDVRRDAPTALIARLPVDTAAKSASWDEYLVLPVVDENSVVLGGLTRVALRRALETAQATPLAQLERSIAVHLVVALFATLSGLLVTLFPDKERRP